MYKLNVPFSLRQTNETNFDRPIIFMNFDQRKGVVYFATKNRKCKCCRQTVLLYSFKMIK